MKILHGDTSVYGSMTSLGQWWKYYPLLVKPQGGYGTILGDKASAMRYTEVNMGEFAWDIFFKDWDDIVVDFKDNYSGNCYEPEFLPSRFPTALVFGTTGLGYALYAGVPQFNLKDIANLTNKLIDDESYNKCTLIPDFANECDIVNTDFKKIFEIGEGTFRIRARILENEKGNLEIKSIPYQTNWRAIHTQIKELKTKSKIEGIVDIIDRSEGKEELDFNMEIILKKGSDSQKIKEMLYKSTSLETTFVVNFEFTNDYENVHYNIKSYLLDWIEFRMETKKRFYIGKYTSLNKEYHMLETIIKIISKPNSDIVLTKLMRKADNRNEIITGLIKQFDITDLQADVIADFKYSQLSKSSLGKYIDRAKELDKILKHILSMLDDDQLIKDEIKDEIKEIRDKYYRQRKCELVDVDTNPFIPNTDHTMIVTKKGYMKKLPKNEPSVGFLETGDKILTQIDVNNKEDILIFTKIGKCYKIKVSDVMACPIEGTGINISNIIALDQLDKVISMVKRPDSKTSNNMVIFVTKSGLVKKTELGNFNGATKNGLIAILMKKLEGSHFNESGLEPYDTLEDVIVLNKNKEIILYTSNGRALRFNSKEIPSTLRSSSGVIGIRLLNKDRVIGMVEVDKKKKYMVIVTSSGNAKKCLIDNFDKSARAKEGITVIGGLDESKEKIVGISSCNESDTVKVFLNTRTDEYDVKDFKELTKLAKGKKLIPCRNNEHIIAIS